MPPGRHSSTRSTGDRREASPEPGDWAGRGAIAAATLPGPCAPPGCPAPNRRASLAVSRARTAPEGDWDIDARAGLLRAAPVHPAGAGRPRCRAAMAAAAVRAAAAAAAAGDDDDTAKPPGPLDPLPTACPPGDRVGTTGDMATAGEGALATAAPPWTVQRSADGGAGVECPGDAMRLAGPCCLAGGRRPREPARIAPPGGPPAKPCRCASLLALHASSGRPSDALARAPASAIRVSVVPAAPSL